MKDDELFGQIPNSAKEFRFANFVIKLTGYRNGVPTGYIMKNTESQNEHYHIYRDQQEQHLHKTLEGKDGSKNEHIPINIEDMLQRLGLMLSMMFSQFNRINMDDNHFIGKKVIFISKPEMFVEKATSKKVFFEQEYDEYQMLFEEIDITRNWFGAVYDENDVETHMIVVKDGQIFTLDLQKLEADSEYFEKIMNPKRAQKGL